MVKKDEETGKSTWMCPECNPGFYTDAEGQCQECSKMVPGCTECNLERCLACGDDMIPQVDG